MIEDVFAVGAIIFAAFNPVAILVVILIFLIVFALVLPKVIRAMRRMLRAIKSFFRGQPARADA